MKICFNKNFPHCCKNIKITLQLAVLDYFAITSEIWCRKKQKKILTKVSGNILKRILEKDCVYVDKTGLILKLIESGNHYYFISRPRKFGKSLLLDTIKEIFLGNKELFMGTEIQKSNYDWRKYPVLIFNFSTTNSAKNLETEVDAEIERLAKVNQILVQGTNFQERLQTLLQHTETVILVDEYDFPVMHNDFDPRAGEQCQQILQNFFSILENSRIKFMLVTGVSETSIWNGANKLLDITMDPDYSALLGFTENEYKINFNAHIRKFVVEKNLSENTIRNEIRFRYNGYRFSKKNCTVHNPHSIRQYLDIMEPRNFWIDLGPSPFLINQMWKRPREAVSLLLRSTFDLTTLQIKFNDSDRVPLVTFLFQTGYLTIREYHPETNFCEIDFPNEEVRETYIKCLMSEFGAVGLESTMEQRATIRKNLEEIKIYEFIENVQIEFHRMLYILAKLGKEDVFGFTFRVILSLCTVKSAEIKDMPLTFGRSDFVSVLPEIFYVFELQLISWENFTINEAEIQEYRRKYSKGRKESVVMSLSYNPDTCFIEKWRATVYEDDRRVAEFPASVTLKNKTGDQNLSAP